MVFLTLGMTANKIELIDFDSLPLNKEETALLSKQKILSVAHVTTDQKNETQSFTFYLAGIHKRSCRFAMKKLRRYESLKDYIDIIDESKYNNETKELFVVVNPPIIPKKFILDFKIDRIEKIGVYPFIFEKGFLKGLVGEIHASEYKRKCLFYISANWKGKKTSFSNGILELFATTIGELAMKKLFRVSSTL